MGGQCGDQDTAITAFGPQNAFRHGEIMPPLTDAKIRATKADTRERKLFDGGGLYLLVHPNGSKYWRLKYRFAGREGKLSFGVYPEVSLREARERAEAARRRLRDGIDPSVEKQIARLADAETFKAVAMEWLQTLSHPPKPTKKSRKLPKPALAASTIQKKEEWLEDYVYRFIGHRPIKQISAPEMLTVLRRVESRGIIETAHRVLSTCGRIFRYAVATGRCERDVTADLRGALTPVTVTHHAALTDPQAVGGLLRAIDGYRGEPTTQVALKLLPYLFLRSKELRYAKWSEIDFDAKQWRLKPARMKMKEMHIVPLPHQAIALLEELQQWTGNGPLLFPGVRSNDRPISENTINGALRRLGFTQDEMTGHGFRTVASTFLNEQGWDPDLIELQLAHAERDESRASYNRAQRLTDRSRMMQAWADYLDGLRSGANVVAIRSKAG